VTIVCPRPDCAELNASESLKCETCGAWLTAGPHKVAEKARNISSYAIAKKLLIPGPCALSHLSKCHGRIEGHHDDYSKPLEVRWLCIRHHRYAHRRAVVEGRAA
jgi:hypothetical protein